MEFLWKALLILAIDIVLAFSAKGEPIFTTQLLCQFTGICPPNRNQHVPSSNPAITVPPAPATSSSPHRDNLEDSVLSILYFIKTQIEQNPDLKHVETHMDILVGVPVSTLTKGGLAGYDEAGLVRLLRTLSSNLPRLTTNPPPKQDNHKKDQQETPTNKEDLPAHLELGDTPESAYPGSPNFKPPADPSLEGIPATSGSGTPGGSKEAHEKEQVVNYPTVAPALTTKRTIDIKRKK